MGDENTSHENIETTFIQTLHRLRVGPVEKPGRIRLECDKKTPVESTALLGPVPSQLMPTRESITYHISVAFLLASSEAVRSICRPSKLAGLTRHKVSRLEKAAECLLPSLTLAYEIFAPRVMGPTHHLPEGRR